MSASVDIAGAGAFGTALAIALARAGLNVTLWARDGAGDIASTRENRRRLPGHPLPPGLRVTGAFSDLGADLMILTVPTQTLDGFLQDHRPAARMVLSCAKGIHRATGLGPTGVIARHLPGATVGQLTGPSFAQDIASGLPTALTIACADDGAGATMQDRLSTPVLRFYRTTDVIGAELGGALKNVIAIAAGAVIGAGLGESARAALMARGFAEMRRVATAQGAQDDTLSGLSGLGDLVLTCTSDKSRNYRYGLSLAGAAEIAPGTTVEGVATAQELAAHPDIDTPIADAVAALSQGQITLRQAAATLLNRPLKPE